MKADSLTRFAYVKSYELDDRLLPGTYLAVRVDGKGFHGFAEAHSFDKPNDSRALMLMNHAATQLMESSTLGPHIILAFGQSDEYSFVFSKTCDLFNRRSRCISSLYPIRLCYSLPALS